MEAVELQESREEAAAALGNFSHVAHVALAEGITIHAARRKLLDHVAGVPEDSRQEDTHSEMTTTAHATVFHRVSRPVPIPLSNPSAGHATAFANPTQAPHQVDTPSDHAHAITTGAPTIAQALLSPVAQWSSENDSTDADHAVDEHLEAELAQDRHVLPAASSVRNQIIAKLKTMAEDGPIVASIRQPLRNA